MCEVALFQTKGSNRDPGEGSKFTASFLEKFRLNKWLQYKSDQNCQSIISDLQAVIQNLQQDARGFLIGPSFTSPSLLLCPISQIQYWPNWTTSSLPQITMSPGLCSTPPIRVLFPTQFTRQTFTRFQDAAQGWLFWSLSWTWEVALMPLSPLCYYNNSILLW